jgi:hypothetical protein
MVFTHGTLNIEGTFIFVLATIAENEKRPEHTETVMSDELTKAVENAKIHVNRRQSEPYLKGWADASALMPRNNPYPHGSPEHGYYELGYTESREDDSHNGSV